MSKFRDLVESIIVGEEAPFWTFGEDTLEEGLVPSNAPIGKLVNKLDSFIKDGKPTLEVKLYSTGRDIKKKDEIVSYYLTIKETKTYKFHGCKIEVPVTIRCRCSTHDKPEQEINPPKDINVYIPNPSFPKTFNNRGGIMCYDLSEPNLDKYVANGYNDILLALKDKRNYIEMSLNAIKGDVLKDVINLPAQEVVFKYKFLNRDTLYFSRWFQDWLKQVKALYSNQFQQTNTFSR